MRTPGPVVPCFVLFLAALSLLACGSSSQLQTVTITPATGSTSVKFVATGTYTDSHKVTPLTALWTQNGPWVLSPVNALSIGADGTVSCLSVAGTFTIVATAPIDPHVPISQLQQGTPQVSGSAQITCP